MSLAQEDGSSVVVWGGLTNACASNVISAEVGYSHLLLLKSDGTVQTCDAYHSPGPAPTPAGLSNVSAIATTWSTNLALTGAGTVLSWPLNSSQAMLVPGASNITAIAAGAQSAVALKADGTVLTLVGNAVSPPGLTNVVAVSAGSGILALKANGTVVPYGGWPSYWTNQISSLTNIVAVSAGYEEWLALRADGTITGQGFYAIPPGLSNIESIASSCGNDHHLSMALSEDGTVAGWGFNFYSGQQPTVPPGLSNVVSIAAGGGQNLALVGGGPPRLTSPLLARAARIGGSVFFRVQATGAWPLRYQWRCNGEDIPDATNSILTIADVQPNHAGAYSVRIVNNAGSIESPTAQLRVGSILISTPPQEGLTFAGGTAAFAVVAEGSNPLSYQWQHDGQDIVGETNSVLSLTNVQFAQAGDYSVTVSNEFGQVTTTAVPLTVQPLLIVSQPKDEVTYLGGPARFEVVVQGQEPLSYWWYRNGKPIPNVTGNSLCLSNANRNLASDYTVAVSNSFGGIISQAASLSVVNVACWGLLSKNDVPPDAENALGISTGGRAGYELRNDSTWTGWSDLVESPFYLTNVVEVTGSSMFIAALTVTGTVQVTGITYWGATNVPSDLSNVVAVAAQYIHCLALTAEGRVRAWGGDYRGSATVPEGLSGVVSIAAGAYHNMVLTADGQVLAWGDNQYGQTNVPAGITDAIAIASGWWHNLILRADGTVIGFGYNAYGQATPPAGLTNVVAIACGNFHSLALKEDGTVVAWGKGTTYDPGSSDYGQALVPAGLSNVVAIAGGDYFSLALIGDTQPMKRVTPQEIAWDGSTFRLSVPTETGRTYRLEYKDSLNEESWTALPLVAGNGRVRSLEDNSANGANRFYRVRRW